MWTAEAAGFVTTVWLLSLRRCLESSVVLLSGFGAAPVTVMGEAEWEEEEEEEGGWSPGMTSPLQP